MMDTESLIVNPGVIKKIGIFGHVGNENLGDEAIITAIIQNFKRRYPHTEFCGFTLNPRDTAVRHNIAAFPIRRIVVTRDEVAPYSRDHIDPKENAWIASLLGQIKIRLKSFPLVFSFLKMIQRVLYILGDSLKEPGFLLQSSRNLKGIDLLIIAGSQQLIDYVAGGPWGHPYTIFKWVLLARLNKAKVAFVSCGAGPIQSALSKYFIRTSLSLASYRSFRDEVSRKCIEEIGGSGQDCVFPDLVYSLSINGKMSDPISSTTRQIIGINPVPFFDAQGWVGGGTRAYEAYVGKLACFASWLIEHGYAILFFPTQLRADPPVIEDLMRLMKENGSSHIEQNLIDYPIHSFRDLISVLSITDMIVATRFHGIVIPYLLNKPVLGIAYANKTDALMEQMGQGEYGLDILQLDLESLRELFILLESRKQENKRIIAQRVSSHREKLDLQYNEIFRLLEYEQ